MMKQANNDREPPLPLLWSAEKNNSNHFAGLPSLRRAAISSSGNAGIGDDPVGGDEENNTRGQPPLSSKSDKPPLLRPIILTRATSKPAAEATTVVSQRNELSNTEENGTLNDKQKKVEPDFLLNDESRHRTSRSRRPTPPMLTTIRTLRKRTVAPTPAPASITTGKNTINSNRGAINSMKGGQPSPAPPPRTIKVLRLNSSMGRQGNSEQPRKILPSTYQIRTRQQPLPSPSTIGISSNRNCALKTLLSSSTVTTNNTNAYFSPTNKSSGFGRAIIIQSPNTRASIPTPAKKIGFPVPNGITVITKRRGQQHSRDSIDSDSGGVPKESTIGSKITATKHSTTTENGNESESDYVTSSEDESDSDTPLPQRQPTLENGGQSVAAQRQRKEEQQKEQEVQRVRQFVRQEYSKLLLGCNNYDHPQPPPLDGIPAAGNSRHNNEGGGLATLLAASSQTPQTPQSTTTTTLIRYGTMAAVAMAPQQQSAVYHTYMSADGIPVRYQPANQPSPVKQPLKSSKEHRFWSFFSNNNSSSDGGGGGGDLLDVDDLVLRALEQDDMEPRSSIPPTQYYGQQQQQQNKHISYSNRTTASSNRRVIINPTITYSNSVVLNPTPIIDSKTPIIVANKTRSHHWRSTYNLSTTTATTTTTPTNTRINNNNSNTSSSLEVAKISGPPYYTTPNNTTGQLINRLSAYRPLTPHVKVAKPSGNPLLGTPNDNPSVLRTPEAAASPSSYASFTTPASSSSSSGKNSRNRRHLSEYQLSRLEEEFLKHFFLSSGQMHELGMEIGLTKKQITHWMINRRVKARKLNPDGNFPVSSKDPIRNVKGQTPKPGDVPRYYHH